MCLFVVVVVFFGRILFSFVCLLFILRLILFLFTFYFLVLGRLALNEERLDKELAHVTIRIYRTKSDNNPTSGYFT